MTSSPLPAATLAQLARTRPTGDGAGLLRSTLHARRMLLLKALLIRVLRHRAEHGTGVYERFQASWQLLERVERRRPDAVRDVLDYPTTGTWLAVALAAPPGPVFDEHLARLDSLAVTAALRAGCPLDLTVPTTRGGLHLTGVGMLPTEARQVSVIASSHLARLTPAPSETAEGPGAPPSAAPARPVLLLPAPRGGMPKATGLDWKPLYRLPGSGAILDDLDPYRVPAGGIGMPPRGAATLDAAERSLWAARWRAAMELLTATDRGRAGEVRRIVRLLVPLEPADEGGSSIGATLRAAPGAVLASLPRGPGEMAEIAVHESHHTKLAAVHELVPLYRTQGAHNPPEVHRVGWRTDARPLAGVLQGAYAHLALIDLWHRAAVTPGIPAAWRSRAARQFERVHHQVGEALSILLESDELTIAGREFSNEMHRHHACLGATTKAVR
ncbi:aKG-HExxH-type peptide beta-hydroxylase [Streptomyces sp. NPDC054975]